MSSITLPRQYHGLVTATAQLSPKIILMQIKTEEPVRYAAGQYASFLIESARRPLSFATPDTYPYLEFIVDVSPGGIASQFVANLKPQNTVAFLSPYGRFTVNPAGKHPLLFVATGSGIAPLRAQILDLLERFDPRPMVLAFGNTNEEHLFLDDEFIELTHVHPTLRYLPVCSSPGATWAGHRGLVSEIVPREITSLSSYDCYICGNPSMVKDMKAVLDQHGVPKDQVFTEQFT